MSLLTKLNVTVLVLFAFVFQASAETWKPEFFYSLTQVGYDQRPLLGAETTTRIIQKTLQNWYPEIQIKSSVFNASPDQVGSFLKEVHSQTGVVITHIGLRQDGGAQWQNLDDSYTRPLSLLESLSPQKNIHIVLLDVCHSTAIARLSDVWRKFADLTFFAAREDQVTYEFKLDSRQPVDLRKRYPQACEWIRKNIPDHNQNISFFGLIWLQAWLETSTPPQTREDWIQFGEKCHRLSLEFAKDHSRLASEITVE